jgi:NAD+ kinase
MKIGLVVHPYRESAAALAEVFAGEATRRGIEVLASSRDAKRIHHAAVLPAEDVSGCDLVVAIGGDGTVLQAVRLALAADKPVLGVNAGDVGFLAQVEAGRISEALDAIVTGRYGESLRMTLGIRLPGHPPASGINDVVVEKVASGHVARISVTAGEEHLVTYRADGVVVATPTGSTAYTFSAGGPLLDPELDALVVTAVAPHNLFGRPIVFRPSVRLRLAVEGDRSARVNVDGRTMAVLSPGEHVEVCRGDQAARFVELFPRNFAAAVRDKFRLHDA